MYHMCIPCVCSRLDGCTFRNILGNGVGGISAFFGSLFVRNSVFDRLASAGVSAGGACTGLHGLAWPDAPGFL